MPDIQATVSQHLFYKDAAKTVEKWLICLRLEQGKLKINLEHFELSQNKKMLKKNKINKAYLEDAGANPKEFTVAQDRTI